MIRIRRETTSEPRRTLAEWAWRIALALAAIVAASRIVLPGDENRPVASTVAPAASRAPSSTVKPKEALDAELAQLYAACPMAAVVNLATLANSPERAEALLPPYRATAERVTDAGNSSPPRAGQWLVDPSEWYTPEERAQRDGAAGAKVEPATTPKVSEPPAVSKPPVKETKQEPADKVPTLPFAAPTFPARPATPVQQEKHSTSGSVPSAQPAPPIFPAPGVKTGATTVAPKTAPAVPGTLPGATQEAKPQALPFAAPQLTPSAIQTGPALAAPAAVEGTQVVAPEAKPQALTAPAVPSAPTTPPFGPPPVKQGEELPLGEKASPATPVNVVRDGNDPHLALYARNAYPSARECAKCHEDIYRDWSISAHAYASVSPMFHRFEQKLNDISQGTIGYFCVRCHAPVATNLNISRAEPIWNQPEVAREGITCIACHRVQYVYGKSNGERRIEEGNLFAPVLGGIGGEGVAEVIRRKDEFKVKTSAEEKGPGQEMHVSGIYFEPLTKSEFCTPCHQVAVHPGIKLEVVWEQYRASPACKKGISCQDCHMGRVPGLPLGYEVGPVAKVADKTVHDGRKKSNHVFYGPNYSIAHPGVFPFHLKADRWTIEQWLLFDWRAGWGTEEFENRVASSPKGSFAFPECWAETDDRQDAREIVEENLKALSRKRDLRIEIMENGSHVEGPCFEAAPRCGQDLAFHFVMKNTNEGHNLLTASLGAQPQLWANVALIGPDGQRLWESGYTDSLGDLANIHSDDVRNGRLPFDAQLFNLQTMFLITGAKGTDREFYVPVNVDFDQLPFIRPGAQPISVINHPPFIRMESQSLAPLGSREARYLVPGHLLRQPGKYRLSFRMRSRAEPMYLMRFCNATIEMQRSMNEWMIDLHQKSVEFEVR